MRGHRCRPRGWRCVVLSCFEWGDERRLVFQRGTLPQIQVLCADTFRRPGMQVHCLRCFRDEPTDGEKWDAIHAAMTAAEEGGVVLRVHSFTRNLGVHFIPDEPPRDALPALVG